MLWMTEDYGFECKVFHSRLDERCVALSWLVSGHDVLDSRKNAVALKALTCAAGPHTFACFLAPHFFERVDCAKCIMFRVIGCTFGPSAENHRAAPSFARKLWMCLLDVLRERLTLFCGLAAFDAVVGHLDLQVVGRPNV